MNLFIYQLLFFILIYIKSAHNYPTGAPDTVCGTMLPGHGVNSQTCSTRYIIQSDKSQYYTNETIRITVNVSKSGDNFEGILLVAKTQTSGQIIGTWSIMSSTIQTLDCDGVANTGVTHISNDGKSLVQAIWTPPSTVSTESTIIRATIVKSYSIIYVNCFSITLTNRQNIPSTNGTIVTATSSSNTLATATSVPQTSDILVATTTVPQTSNVGVNISWTYTNGVTVVKMKISNLETSQWLALGLSLDNTMGNDHVFVCKRLSDDTVKLERRVNPGGHSPPVLASTITNPGGTFSTTLQKLENGMVSCEFTLSNFGSSKRRRRDVTSLSQSTSYYPLIAIGNLDSSNNLIQHVSRTALSQMVQLNKNETITYNIDSSGSSRISLLKAHGIIMIFTWILFASTGILVARHFKPSWPEKKICGKAIWFIIHRTLMTSVAILTIIAFILILVFTNGKWVSRTSQREFAHSIVGVILVCFTIIQPIMALFRCAPEAENRFIFNYAHRTLGFTAFILSIAAIFLAFFFTQFNFQTMKDWAILVVWACWLPIIFFIFWFIDFYFRRDASKPENVESYDLATGAPKYEPVQAINTVKQDRIKLAFLLIHIFVALVLALALASLVGKIN